MVTPAAGGRSLMMRLLSLLLLGHLLAAVEVPLLSPLSTRVAAPHPGGPARLLATVTVPPGAPDDLGCAVWIADRHGRWWQRIAAHRLAPGRHELSVEADAAAAFRPEGHGQAWNAYAARLAHSGGLLLWSSRPGATVRIDNLRFVAGHASAGPTPKLILASSPAREVRCGTRWEARWRVEPAAADPWDPAEPEIRMDAAGPGGQRLAVAAFYDQPMRAWDRGDREEVVPWGSATMTTRLRATAPGTWGLRIAATWRDGTRAMAELPGLTAQGPSRDGIVRVDAGDPRFFSVDGRWVWPLGPNLHSVWDVRGEERTGSRLTPNRGSLSYAAWFDRLAASGANAAEIWLSAWNLALEWRGDWAPWRGAGQYSEERAWQLDRVLTLAEERGIRINLVINNHGQASVRTDREWEDNPANRAAGGWLDDPVRLFDDARALDLQDRHRRHLIARYGDSPAILGWKLWSEVNLTEIGRQAGERKGDKTAARTLLQGWHERATARFAVLDPWRHPVTTHWAGNYMTPDREICAQPGIDYICIDAYHGADGPPLWSWLNRSTADPSERRSSGLAVFGKPVVVTEYGGNWDAAPEPLLEVAVRIGGWVSLVAGHGGGPMLWWHEWLDQRGHFGPYQALARFLAGEDLRGSDRACRTIQANTPGTTLWGRTWSGPGRMLGYILDEGWGRSGGDGALLAGATCVLGENLRPGPIHLAWWDADLGSIVTQGRIEHLGGRLEVPVPPFRRHLAFKAWRD
jgi:hypothetical protein